jgi:transposase
MMQLSPLPEMPEVQESAPEPPTLPAAARVVRPVRTQLEWVTRSLDDALPEAHLARAVWAFVERLELDSFYASIKAVVDGPGRPPSDPKVLLALWVYATADGVGKARQLARLCCEHDAYRWLRGGVPINYHMLSDFRVARKAELDELLTQILASLMSAGLVEAERVAQDGVRLRAGAGAASFRRKERLEQFLEQAGERVRQLSEEQPDPCRTAMEQAAQERAARERTERIERALAEMPKVEAIKERQKRKLAKGKREKVGEARVSTTDPEARVMKMADGGYRPALNAQFATDMDSQVIVGVAVVNQGTDLGLAAPMETQVAERTGRHPSQYVVDGGFACLDDVVTLTRREVVVYTPSRPPTGDDRAKDPTLPRPGDPPEVADWRVRMGTEEAKALYRDRGAAAECVNAQIEGRYGLRQLPVRGLERALAVLLLVAVAHNLLRWIALTT